MANVQSVLEYVLLSYALYIYIMHNITRVVLFINTSSYIIYTTSVASTYYKYELVFIAEETGGETTTLAGCL